MNILVIGSGGREHALCWKIKQSPLVKTLYCTPGNGGIDQLATAVTLDINKQQDVITFCKSKNIDLVVIGPEQPLVDGLADALEDADIHVFGPSAKAAQLEGSKGFTKDICREYGIPTAAYGRFNNAADAKKYVVQQGAPIVIKADGLAAGKGVILAQTNVEAFDAIDDIFGGAFGAAGAEVVVEEMLYGEEASFFALCDGENILPLASAQDHKAVYDGDIGPNTGGMGAYSPTPVMTSDIEKKVIQHIIKPTVQAMKDKGSPYKGVFFAGLIITESGPKLIEYNCRFGDPECQVLMCRLQSDIVPALVGVAKGDISHITLDWADAVVMNVVMCANGYPASYDKGSIIRNIDQAEDLTQLPVFHAGTKNDKGHILANGGRVLNIMGQGQSVTTAQKVTYQAVSKIDWKEGFTRSDIGWRAVQREL